MKKKTKNTGICIKILLVFCFFASINLNYNTINAKQISTENIKTPLSSSQIDNFAVERGITPIAIKVINNFTIILYEKKGIIGAYALTFDQQGNLKTEANSGGRKIRNSSPITLGSSGGTEINVGEYNFTWLIINDEQILNKADTVRIIFKNKTEKSESVDRRKGVIIPNSSGKLDLQHIYILDKESNILYEKTFD